METVEIRPNRLHLILFIGALTIALLTMIYVTFFTDYYKGQHIIWKLVTVAFAASMIATIHKLYKVIKANTPEIVMTKSNFNHYRKDTIITFQWRDISSVEISKEDNNTYLILEVFGNKEKILVDWLDKSPTQIEELIWRFKYHEE